MNELIKIDSREMSGTTIQTCNARDLWQFVESKQDFSTWIKSRIAKYGFTQAIDFVVIDNFINDGTAFGGKRKTIDYHIALDMAKELAMVGRSAKGKQVRQYFIACERKVKTGKSAVLTQPVFRFSTKTLPAVSYQATLLASNGSLSFIAKNVAEILELHNSV
ncbi:antA/AntB antirepressor family protein [Methylomonas sp. HYX-M1]|uniref:antA/AntB antirepressor family protein n=1 Tax=Methylomonas sp. HYX-M1 TaxID=3139307 RepID=UPI00345C4999